MFDYLTNDVSRRRQAGETVPVLFIGFVLPLQASMGVALAQCDTDTDPMELVRRADKAMYEAKRAAHAARDQIVVPTS